MADRQLKILMLAPTPYFADRGCHVRIFEEARALQAKGHQVRVVSYHLGRDMPGIPTDRIVHIPWYGKMSAGPSWHKPYLDILLFFKALKVSGSFRPDLIHAHLHEGAFIGIFLKKILKVPLLFDCQGSLTGEVIDHGFMRENSWLASLFRTLERFVNRNVDAIITSSTHGAESLIGNWGIPAEMVNSLTDGVNTDEFCKADKEHARRALKLPDCPVVVFLGLFNRYQGVDLLLDVIEILKQRGVAAHFLLMGFPEDRYRQIAREKALDGMITFTGRIDYQKAAYYLSAGDLAVSPKISLTEANGKLFNYMACGIPCLVFDTPVNREILGDAGVYASFGDPKDFADRIEALLSEPATLEHLGNLVREKAVLEHSWQSRGEQLIHLYLNLLK